MVFDFRGQKEVGQISLNLATTLILIWHKLWPLIFFKTCKKKLNSKICHLIIFHILLWNNSCLEQNRNEVKFIYVQLFWVETFGWIFWDLVRIFVHNEWKHFDKKICSFWNNSMPNMSYHSFIGIKMHTEGSTVNQKQLTHHFLIHK